MNEMQLIVTDVRGVCLSVSQSVCLSVCLSVYHTAQLGFTVRRSFSAAFAKSLWHLVILAFTNLLQPVLINVYMRGQSQYL